MTIASKLIIGALAATLSIGAFAKQPKIIAEKDKKAAQCAAFLDAAADYRALRAYGHMIDRKVFYAELHKMNRMIAEDPDKAGRIGLQSCDELHVIR